MYGGKRSQLAVLPACCVIANQLGIDTNNRFHSYSCSTVVMEQNTLPTQALQVFVQVLDSCFENVCELDLIYHFDRAWDLGKSQLVCLASTATLQGIGRHVYPPHYGHTNLVKDM